MMTGFDHASAAGTSAPRKPPDFNGANNRHTGRNHRILGIDEDVNIATMICLISAQIPRPGAEAVAVGQDEVALGAAKCSCVRLRRDRGAGRGCWAACLVALALLFAVCVFAL